MIPCLKHPQLHIQKKTMHKGIAFVVCVAALVASASADKGSLRRRTLLKNRKAAEALSQRLLTLTDAELGQAARLAARNRGFFKKLSKSVSKVASGSGSIWNMAKSTLGQYAAPAWEQATQYAASKGAERVGDMVGTLANKAGLGESSVTKIRDMMAGATKNAVESLEGQGSTVLDGIFGTQNTDNALDDLAAGTLGIN